MFELAARKIMPLAGPVVIEVFEAGMPNQAPKDGFTATSITIDPARGWQVLRYFYFRLDWQVTL